MSESPIPFTASTITDDALDDLYARVERAEGERDDVYQERAHLLAWLAALHPNAAVITGAQDMDEPGWLLLILTVKGRQLSWHIAPRDAGLFSAVERVSFGDPRAVWDGHSTEEKYGRIRGLAGPRGSTDTAPVVRATCYEVSCLPEGDIDTPVSPIEVVYRGGGVWAVTWRRYCLGSDGRWSFEPRSTEREDDWLAAYRFPLDEALRLAEAAALESA